MVKLLVANRGEIACRIMRSARDLGWKTVAIHSDPDAQALHVSLADESVAIGGSRAADSYLIGQKIIQACRQTGATVVHPGYGFLAESAEFAREVASAGLTFVGPHADTIEQMGDKARARDAAIYAGVPVLPGSSRFALGDLDGVTFSAQKIGYPLLVKATAGGGGIGMRRVDRAEDLAAAIATTQQLAARAFGDATVYLERYIDRARHVEVQVFGFGDGRALHLYERDCSIQRRFQKIIEQSPAPDISASTLSRMYEAATAIACAVSYAGAGTIEFIVDAETGEFYFLEMNTRIQVEHPVTEMVTGVDLIALQLQLAMDQLHFEDITIPKPRCHAIECRIYAEDATRNFLPSPGRLTEFRTPENSSNVRVDTGVREGDTITPFYDPMIAKLICRGESREEAIATALRALDATSISGVSTNIAYLKAILNHREFSAGRVHTGFIAQHGAELSSASSQRHVRSQAQA